MADAGVDRMTARTCSIEGCGGGVRARGWCGAHWQRWYRNGTPYATKQADRCGLCNQPTRDHPITDNPCRPLVALAWR